MNRHPNRERQKAVVTGADGGLGRAFDAVLTRAGYDVTGVDVVGSGRRLDVTEPEACRALAEEIRPVLWVNNAGVLGAGDAVTQPDAEVRHVVDVNLLGVVWGTRAAAEVMRGGRVGTILNVASLASWTGVPGEAVYAATKHAVRAFSVGIQGELRETGVAVKFLCPDGIRTPMLEHDVDNPASRLSFTRRHLLEPEEVADAGLALIRSRRLVRSIPRGKGLQLRLLGIAPAVGLALEPAIEWIAERNRRRLAPELHATTARGSDPDGVARSEEAP